MEITGIGSFIVTSLLVSLVALTSTALAGSWQGWRGGGSWGMNSAYQRNYNPATGETLPGEMVSMDWITPMQGMKFGIHLTLKTGKETVSSHGSPAQHEGRRVSVR